MLSFAVLYYFFLCQFNRKISKRTTKKEVLAWRQLIGGSMVFGFRCERLLVKEEIPLGKGEI